MTWENNTNLNKIEIDTLISIRNALQGRINDKRMRNINIVYMPQE